MSPLSHSSALCPLLTPPAPARLGSLGETVSGPWALRGPSLGDAALVPGRARPPTLDPSHLPSAPGRPWDAWPPTLTKSLTEGAGFWEPLEGRWSCELVSSGQGEDTGVTALIWRV